MSVNATPLTIWTNHRVTSEQEAMLHQGVRPHRLLISSQPGASNLVAAALDDQAKEAQVIFGQPDPATFLSLPRLRWVHLTSAGYERYDRPEIRQAVRARGIIVTNSSSVFDEPCAQHVLAMMMSLARQLPWCVAVQNGDHSWPTPAIRAQCYLMTGATVVILGYGAIARRLIELLTPLRVNIIAVRRGVRGDETVRTVPHDQVDSVLPLADHVVNILPGGDTTVNFLSARRIALLRPTAILYNIGRGSTLDQEALAEVLQANRLRAAYLDVMIPEPLPPDHRLWKLPNCFITPHTAGGYQGEMERQLQHFLQNLHLYASGQALLDRIM